jgi:hypothetical protein
LLLLAVLMENDPALAAEYGSQYEKLIAQLPPDLEYINQVDPSRTLWPTTRIVKLLQQAEVHTPRVRGMTRLSDAGRFIKEQSPELTVREYRLKTLREVLRASRMFAIAVADDGATVLYRSLSMPPESSVNVTR